MDIPPDQVLSDSDPGDDTHRRYRYQSAQAAILVLALLDDDTETEEVFCEHHEDILVKRKDSTFVGYQIKSRTDGAEPIKASDEEALHSIRKFISIDAQFGTHFTRYVLGSSCGFWKAKKNGSNLPYLLELAESANNGSLPSPLQAYLKKFCPKQKAPSRTRAARSDAGNPSPHPNGSEGVSPASAQDPVATAFRTLRKVRVENLPSIRDMDAALVKIVQKVSVIGDRMYSELETLAQSLVQAMCNASSLAHESIRERYINLCLDPSAVQVEEIINGKRINKDRLLAIINAVLSAGPTLCANGQISIDSLPKGMGKLALKLAKGGVSVSNIDLAKDLKASAEYFLTRVLQKRGRADADAQYQHLRTLVRSICQEAHDRTKRADELFGPAMLNEVREQLRTKYDQNKDNLFGCEYEHLLGMAGILTEECALWWTDPFPIPGETQP